MSVDLVYSGEISGTQKGFGYYYGEEVNKIRKASGIPYKLETIKAFDATYIIECTDAFIYVIIITSSVQGFLPKPRPTNLNYILTEDTLSVLLTKNQTTGEWTTTPKYPLSIPYVSKLKAGNIDWIGTSQEDKPETAEVFSFKGPSGRLIPFDRKKLYPEYSKPDEETFTDSYYTCFGPSIYKNGTIYHTFEKLVETDTKVLGVAKQGNVVVAIVDVNYRDVPNPEGAIGGFFQYVLVQLSDSNSPFKGWKVVSVYRTGGATDIWRFNKAGTIAVNGTQQLNLTLVDSVYSVIFSSLPENAAGERIYYQTEPQGTAWSTTEQSEGTSLYDFAGEALQGIRTTWQQNQSSTRRSEILVPETTLPVYYSAEESEQSIASCSIATGGGTYQHDFGAGEIYHVDFFVNGDFVGCGDAPEPQVAWEKIPATCSPGVEAWVTIIATITLRDTTTQCQYQYLNPAGYWADIPDSPDPPGTAGYGEQVYLCTDFTGCDTSKTNTRTYVSGAKLYTLMYICCDSRSTCPESYGSDNPVEAGGLCSGGIWKLNLVYFTSIWECT